jgi:hypothetical protein
MVALIGNPHGPTTLALESCAARPIDNERLYEISAYETNLFRQFDADYGTNERRSDPTPIYNCHGLTFASRRTGIFESSTIGQILNEDGYVEIPQARVLEGDVIMYFDQESGDFEHSGIVILRPKPENLNVPVVCSKWGKYAEVVHLANNCPYNFGAVKYYRVRT